MKTSAPLTKTQYAHHAPSLLWYSYLIAYAIELLLIFLVHRIGHLKIELKTEK